MISVIDRILLVLLSLSPAVWLMAGWQRYTQSVETRSWVYLEKLRFWSLGDGYGWPSDEDVQ